MFHLYILPLVAAALAASQYDAYETRVGLKKGVALEGNGVINMLAKVFGQTAAAQVYNHVVILGLAALSLSGNPVWIGGAIGGLIARIAAHIQGGIKWRYLNNGGQINRQALTTWWQKLLGMGWD